MAAERTIVVIPARLESSRLPRKVLADIDGKTMLERSYEVAAAADCGPVLVLTDSEEVVDAVEAFGGDVRLTDPALESGTARIASVAADLDADVVVNLQGDAPLTDPSVVAESAQEALASGAPITMPVYPMTRVQDVQDPSVVKVLRGHDGRTLYCSRSPVPHVRDAYSLDWTEATTFWGHVGIYAYSREFLLGFDSVPPSPLEAAERLEQLRWIQAGLRLHTFEVEAQGPSVDTPADLDHVRDAFTAIGRA
jgi:3-deoxy-manno-octulosonate cytidylyltransferase (CMP-KDO synthetase)